jgi:tetratricopeptide (TPR) repeat protein
MKKYCLILVFIYIAFPGLAGDAVQVERNPKSPMTYLESGRLKCGLGQSKEAIKDYNKGLKLNPQCPYLYVARGLAKVKLEQYEEAVKDYNKAIELNPQYAEAYINRGIIRMRSVSSQLEAIKDFDKAIELKPECLKAYINRGMALFLLSPEEAIKNFNKAIELDPKNSKAYCYRGIAKFLIERRSKVNCYNATDFDYSEAMKDYDKAIELGPENFFAYIQRGNINFLCLNEKEARMDFLKAEELIKKQKKTESLKGLEELVRDKLQKLDQKPKYYFDSKPLITKTLFGESGSCKCEKCKSLFAYVSNKYHEIYLRGPKAKQCIHKWEHVEKIDIYNLSLKWFDIKWNKHGFWYITLTKDNSEWEKAVKEKRKIRWHPYYWIPASSYKD